MNSIIRFNEHRNIMISHRRPSSGNFELQQVVGKKYSNYEIGPQPLFTKPLYWMTYCQSHNVPVWHADPVQPLSHAPDEHSPLTLLQMSFRLQWQEKLQFNPKVDWGHSKNRKNSTRYRFIYSWRKNRRQMRTIRMETEIVYIRTKKHIFPNHMPQHYLKGLASTLEMYATNRTVNEKKNQTAQ